VSLSKVIAIAGIALVFLGIIIALVPTTQEIWEEKSYVLADETTKISTWLNHTDILTYYFTKPKDVRNLVVKGFIEEVDNKPFDFEITNTKVFVKAVNVTRYEFNFSPTPQELSNGLKMVISNNRAYELVREDFIVESVEVPKWSDYASTFPKSMLTFTARKAPIKISGTVEGGNYRFNVYVLDGKNYERWKAGQPYNAYFEGKNKTSYSFEFIVPKEKCGESLYVIVEKIPVPKEEEISTSISVSRFLADWYSFIYPVSLTEEPTSDVLVTGSAIESSNHPFTLYILNEDDFERYKGGIEPLKPYFLGRGRSSYDFSFKVPRDRASESLYLIVKREVSNVDLKVYVEGTAKYSSTKGYELSVLVNTERVYAEPVDINVRYHAEASWERRTYAHVFGGFILGRLLAGLGFVLLIASAVVKYVLKK